MKGGTWILVASIAFIKTINGQGALPTECPYPDPIGHTVHLPHETICSKFYICSNGQKIESVCPPGTLFNRYLQVCDWDYVVNCISSLTTTENPNTKTSESSYDDITETPITTTNILSTEEWSTINQENHDDITTDFSSDDTTSWPTNFTPSTTPSTTPSPTHTPSHTPSTAETGPTATDKYWPSTDYSSTWVPTDYKGTLPTKCPFPVPRGHSVHLPHETICSKFYICSNGQRILLVCPPGMFFNRYLQVCDRDYEDSCSSYLTTTENYITTTPDPSFICSTH